MSSGWINLSALRRTLAELGEAEEATGSGRCRRVRLGRGVKSLSQKSGDRGGGLRERLLDRMVVKCTSTFFSWLTPHLLLMAEGDGMRLWPPVNPGQVTCLSSDHLL